MSQDSAPRWIFLKSKSTYVHSISNNKTSYVVFILYTIYEVLLSDMESTYVFLLFRKILDIKFCNEADDILSTGCGNVSAPRCPVVHRKLLFRSQKVTFTIWSVSRTVWKLWSETSHLQTTLCVLLQCLSCCYYCA